MKKLITTLLGVTFSLTLYGQISFLDYTDGRELTYYNTTYKVWSSPNEILESIFTSGKKLYINMGSIDNQYLKEFGQYTDGSYVEDPEEVQGIIKYAPNDRKILYHAMRNVFTLEELEAHPKLMLIVHFVVDNQGKILESSIGFPIQRDYVIQPQQIAALETMLRKNLTFVLDTERAAKFNYFQGEVWLYFRDFINEPTLPDGVQFIGETSQAITSLYTIRLVEDFNYFGEFESTTSPSPITGLYTGELVP